MDHSASGMRARSPAVGMASRVAPLAAVTGADGAGEPEVGVVVVGVVPPDVGAGEPEVGAVVGLVVGVVPPDVGAGEPEVGAVVVGVVPPDVGAGEVPPVPVTKVKAPGRVSVVPSGAITSTSTVPAVWGPTVTSSDVGLLSLSIEVASPPMSTPDPLGMAVP